MKELEKILNDSTEIALATINKEYPNVRLVSFYYQSGIVYFASSRGDQKIKEMLKNNNVAFTTIPNKGISHVRVKQGVVKKSSKTIFDLKEEFSNKIKGYEENITYNGNELELFEVSFSKAKVIVSYDEAHDVTL